MDVAMNQNLYCLMEGVFLVTQPTKDCMYSGPNFELSTSTELHDEVFNFCFFWQLIQYLQKLSNLDVLFLIRYLKVTVGSKMTTTVGFIILMYVSFVLSSIFDLPILLLKPF